jgi:large subunit ribosomal protein L25
MQQTMISAEMRDKAGQRGTLSAFRAGGRIPAVIYGLDKKPLNVTVDEKAMTAALKGGSNPIITIKYQGGEDTVIVKAIQRHPVTDKYRHFDFQRISLTEKIKVKVHVKLVGECYGAKTQAGLVEHTMRELNISCLPTEIPHEVELDITDLHINHSLRIKDIKHGGKYDLLDAPDQIVVSVTAPKEEKVETPAAGAAVAGAEPEVVAAKGKKEEGAEGAAPAAGAKAAPGAKPAAGKPEEKKAEPKK